MRKCNFFNNNFSSDVLAWQVCVSLCKQLSLWSRCERVGSQLPIWTLLEKRLGKRYSRQMIYCLQQSAQEEFGISRSPQHLRELHLQEMQEVWKHHSSRRPQRPRLRGPRPQPPWHRGLWKLKSNVLLVLKKNMVALSNIHCNCGACFEPKRIDLSVMMSSCWFSVIATFFLYYAREKRTFSQQFFWCARQTHTGFSFFFGMMCWFSRNCVKCFFSEKFWQAASE